MHAGFMFGLKILNKKETKRILSLIESQWGASGESFGQDYVFLLNNRSRFFIANRELFDVDFSKLRINSIGLYLGEIMDDGLRLSIEGSQIVGKYSKKGIVELDDSEMRAWLKGEDIPSSAAVAAEEGYVILKHDGDYLGCGRAKAGRILNYVPKTRRLSVSNY